MILVSHEKSSAELKPYISALGIPCEVSPLPFGDACFEGCGPEGRIGVGIERKKLHDMLGCIDDARYTGHQRIGMKSMYQVSILLLEGLWIPHDRTGVLMEGFFDRGGKLCWCECKYRAGRVMYSKLRRYLYSVSLSGVQVCYTRNLLHSAYDIHEWYHYFQKPWHTHTSLLEMQKFHIPTLNAKPSLVRMWANDLGDVGIVKSEAAERLFRKPITLANADETDWMKIPGIGVKTAQSIVRQVWGTR